MMRKEYFSLESTRAKNEIKRASEEMNWIQRVFDYDGDEDDLEEDEESDNKHNLPEDEADALSRRYNQAEEDYKKASEAYDRAEYELKRSSCSFDVVFLRSAYNLHKLSRYETILERRLTAWA